MCCPPIHAPPGSRRLFAEPHARQRRSTGELRRPAFVVEADETGAALTGMFVAVPGDLDADGTEDVFLSDWPNAAKGPSTGALLKAYTCRTPGDAFGFDAVGMGDIDGDATVDLLITSAWSAVNGFHSGRVFILSSGITSGKRR